MITGFILAFLYIHSYSKDTFLFCDRSRRLHIYIASYLSITRIASVKLKSVEIFTTTGALSASICRRRDHFPDSSLSFITIASDFYVSISISMLAHRHAP